MTGPGSELATQIEAMREVGHHAEHLDMREVGREANERRAQDVRGEVHGDVARRRKKRQPLRCLRAVGRAEIDELRAGPIAAAISLRWRVKISRSVRVR